MADTALKRFQIALEGGYTSGAGSVYNGGTAVVANRRLAVEETVMADFDYIFETPVEARGTYAAVYQHPLQQIMVKGKVPFYFYADDLYFIYKMMMSGSPTFVTLPNTPQALLAATAIASSMALTSQPNVQADAGISKLLIVTLANTVTSAISTAITFTGTDYQGNVLTEVVTFSAGTQTISVTGGGATALTCTLYTKNYFKTVTNIATSVQTAGNTVTVSGINAFWYSFPTDMSLSQGGSTLYSATAEYWDGTATWQIPGVCAEKFTAAASIGKSFKGDITMFAQKKTLLPGSTGSIIPAAPAGQYGALQNLADNIIPTIPTYATRFYADPIGTAAGTTALTGRLTDFKLDLDNNIKAGKSADGTPYPTFVGRKTYGDKLKAGFTLLFNSAVGTTYDPTEVGFFIGGLSRTIRAAFPGVNLPCGVLSAAGNWPTGLLDQTGKGGLYGIMYDLAGKYTKMGEKPVEGRQAFDFALDSEVDLQTMGTPLVAHIVSRINPNQ